MKDNTHPIDCRGCPAEYDPCLNHATGDKQAHIIVIGPSPSGFSIGKKQAFYGRYGRLFMQLLELVKRYGEDRYGGVKVFYTYAARVGAYAPTAKHIDKCHTWLMRDIRSVKGFDGRTPVLVPLGPIAARAVGLKFGKIVDVVGSEFSVPIKISSDETQRYTAIPLLSMAHLETKPGTANVVLSGLLKAVAHSFGESDTKATLDSLTKNYVYPQTIEEVSNLVDHVIGYYDEEYATGPEQWAISLDTETNTLKPFSHPDPKVLMLSVGWDDQKAATILLDHPEVPYDPKEAWEHVARLLHCSKPKCFHNWKYDRKFLETVYGYQVNRVTWDTLLGEHYIDEDKKGHYGLKQLTPIYCPEYEGYDDDLQKILRGHEEAADASDDEEDAPADIEILTLSDEELIDRDKASGCPADRIAEAWDVLTSMIDERMQIKNIAKKERTEAQQSRFASLKKDIDNMRAQLYINRPKKVSKKKGKTKTKKDKGFEGVPLETILQYAAVDADVTRIILRSQVARLQRSKDWQDAQRVMKYLYLPGARALSDMEFRGFQIDSEYQHGLITDIQTKIVEVKRVIAKKFSPLLNLNAPHQVSELMSKMNFESIPGEEPGSTGKEILSKYMERYPPEDPRHVFVTKLLEYRENSKVLTTYLRPYAKLAKDDGKIHCSFHGNGTATGRLCVDANTRLVTSHGTFPIAELPEELLGVAKIKTHRNRWRRIVRRYYKGIEQMYHVTLSNGSQITCTGGHQFLTPNGWRSLHDTTVEEQEGYYVCTPGPAHPGAASRTLRGELCEDSFGRRANRSGSAQEVQCQPPYLAHLNECIQNKIREGDKRTAEQELCQVEMGKSLRAEVQASSNIGKGSPGRHAPTRYGIVSNLRQVGDKCLVCSRKHQASQPECHRETAHQDAGGGPNISGTAGSVLSRYYRSSRRLLCQPLRILSEAIQSLYSPERISLVCEGTGVDACVLRREGHHSAGPHLLVSEPCRDASVVGFTSRKHSTYSPIHFLRKLCRRLRISRYGIACRNRWRLSPAGRKDAATGHTSNGQSNGIGISNTAVFRRTGPPQLAESGMADWGRAACIAKVESAGCRPVWDIEVEEDHSYIAQGFVNHNSSSKPNLQNVPYIAARRIARDAEGNDVVVHPGYNIKKLFVPSKPGHVIVNCDIKGAELRVYTAYSEDQLMIDALHKGMDVHSLITSRVYGLDYDTVNALKETDPDIKEKRTRCKRIVFATFYGGGAYTISQQINSTVEEAEQLKTFLFNEFPALRNYVQGVESEVRRYQLVSTFFGRRRRFRLAHVNDRNMSDAIREAVNFKIQSTSADLVLSQLCEMDDNFADIGAEMLITVHDSMTFQMPEENLDKLHAFLDHWIVQRVADKYDWLPVPFLYDVEVGPSYGETKPFEKTSEEKSGEEESATA